MSAVKQVICVRTDLNMRKGKLAAQAAHASLNVFLEQRILWERVIGPPMLSVPLTPEMEHWIINGHTKIVLGVASESDLLWVHQASKDAGIPTSLIQDLGHTEFHGVRTYTACAIGPDLAEKIDAITGPNGVVKTKLL